MKFLFPILSIVVCLGAAYFTWTASEKFTAVQAARFQAMDTNKLVTAKADAADVNIKKEQVLLEESRNALALATQSVLALESDSTALKKDADKIESELQAQTAESAQLEVALKEVSQIFADIGEDIDIDNLAAKIVEIEEDLKTKKIKVDELATLIEGAKTSLANKQKEVDTLTTRKVTRNKRIESNALEARVTAVNQEWGFLVIGAGANSGFTPQTTLLVTRDGRLIGRVNPSAIEPTQTIAEIDLKSLAAGVRIQPGDRVLLAQPAAN